MHRTPAASPGGVQHSDAKKRRLAVLAAQSRADQPLHGKQAKTGVRGSPSPATPQETAQGASSDTRLGEVPYTTLDTRQLHGVVASMMQGLPSSGAATTLERLTDSLLATNPALALRGSEARAAAGLRVQDKSLLLDNPPANKGLGQAARQAPGYATRLRSKRKSPAAITPDALNNLKYSQAQQLHIIWLQYAQRLADSCGKLATSSTAAADAGAHADAAQLVRLLATADMHGCLLRVARHKDARMVGREGIAVHSSAETLWIIDAADRIHVVPKRSCQVSFKLADGRAVMLDARAA